MTQVRLPHPDPLKAIKKPKPTQLKTRQSIFIFRGCGFNCFQRIGTGRASLSHDLGSLAPTGLARQVTWLGGWGSGYIALQNPDAQNYFVPQCIPRFAKALYVIHTTASPRNVGYIGVQIKVMLPPETKMHTLPPNHPSPGPIAA